MLIGLTGYAQHGKDTAGAFLVERYGFEKFAFADALRRAVATLDPWVEYRAAPANEIISYSTALREYGYEEAKKLPEVRRLLQVMGTEVGRDIFGANCWVDALDRVRDESLNERHVITDVRFPNEVEYVRQHGKLIRVRRLNEDLSPFDNGLGISHASEAFIENLPVDYDVEAFDIAGLESTIATIADFELKLGAWDRAEA